MAQRTALVVDDSKSARFALRKYLEAHSYKVDTADSADEAFRHLAQSRPDVIFLDHVMPGADGFDVLRRLKSDPQTVVIPVVICSSNEGEDFGSQARSKGAADVLQKPPRPDELARVLSSLQHVAAALRPAAAAPPAPAVRPAPAKVSPIREPEVAIEQAVLKAVRSALPGAMPPPAAEPRLKAVTPAAGEMSADKYTQLREQMDGRLRKITQDLFTEVAGLKARIAQMDSVPASRGADPTLAAELSQLRAQIDELRQRYDGAIQAIERRLQEVLTAARQAAADEAHAVAERTVMNAAARISNQFAEGILKAMGNR